MPPYDLNSFLAGLAVGLATEGWTYHDLLKKKGNDYLIFYSDKTFILLTANTQKNWDGTIEYSYDLDTWYEWDGTRITVPDNGNNYTIYMRGTSNTIISGESSKRWSISGSNPIYCDGNIETLLDYYTVKHGRHPEMGVKAFSYLFASSLLVTSPELPAIKLTDDCYNHMFYNSRLTVAPKLPATTLAERCYLYMFYYSRITIAPELPATTLAHSCYSYMFGYTGITVAPKLPATTLATYCYAHMFYRCNNLTSAPELPATTLEYYCYSHMFESCSLTEAPELPAMYIPERAYYAMFKGCYALTIAPKLPATDIFIRGYEEMFQNCTSLEILPELPALWHGSSYPGHVPNWYVSMFYGCTNIKISTTQSSEYQYAYRIPASGTLPTGYWAFTFTGGMFSNTGGTFTGTPAVNTTYYTNNPPVL